MIWLDKWGKYISSKQTKWKTTAKKNQKSEISKSKVVTTMLTLHNKFFTPNIYFNGSNNPFAADFFYKIECGQEAKISKK